MKITITSLELKSPWSFFSLANQPRKILKQLRGTPVQETKTTGFWTLHYTMTLWKNEADMKAFARSGEHLNGMKMAGNFSKEIRILTIDGTTLPDWKTAKQLLKEKGKAYRYDK